MKGRGGKSLRKSQLMERNAANRTPTRLSSLIFWGKAALLKAQRGAQDMAQEIRRYPCLRDLAGEQAYSCIVGESRSPLYGSADSTERALQVGKVQNLRRAAQYLHGLCLPPNATFSFWKQVGRANPQRGYVQGRQLREGCLFPAIGGGLCQLSNALYDAAMQAGCEIIERHPHTQVVPGSAAARGRDAAVAWNYIDLRFRAAVPLCLDVILTEQDLIVRFRAAASVAENTPENARVVGSTAQVPGTKNVPVWEASPGVLADAIPPKHLRRSILEAGSTAQVHPAPKVIPLSALADNRPVMRAREHSCVTCGAGDCFRHNAPDVIALREQVVQLREAGRTALLLDEVTPELAAYVHTLRDPASLLFLPLNATRWKSPRYAWPTDGFAPTHFATVPILLRALHAHRLADDGPARRRAQLEGAEALAAHYARALAWNVTHVVVSQSLLPHLWRDGHLGGRSFDVLMTRQPMQTLHAHLDAAFAAHPERALLRDFRAAPELVRWETEALGAARHVITPHADILAQFPRQSLPLDWQMPPVSPRAGANASNPVPARDTAASCPPVVAFPGPTHARKGAQEVRALARSLPCEIIWMGRNLEGGDFWQGIKARHVVPSKANSGEETDWLDGVRVVVQPAVIEDNPRRLLEALARGIPVVASAACGLGDLPGVTTVPFGDEKTLFLAVAQLLEERTRVEKTKNASDENLLLSEKR